jgi:hypothetical protein
MRYLVGFVLFLLALGTLGVVGCGGEELVVELCANEVDFWRKDNPPPLGPDTMVGTYTLDHFIIDMYVDDQNVGRLDSDDFESFSGNLEIQQSTISATVTVEEETETMSGSYTQTASGDEGAFHVVDGTESYDLHYHFFSWSDPHPPGGTLLPCAYDDPALACFLSLQSAGRVCEMTTL